MTLTKKHFTQLAKQLGEMKPHLRKGVLTDDASAMYDWQIKKFLEWCNPAFDEDLFDEAVKSFKELKEIRLNDERIKKHVKAEEMLSKSQFGIVNK